MVSPNTSRQSNRTGFTLIEIMIAVAILTTIFSLGVFISFDFYHSYAFQSEKDMLVSILQKARSQAIHNISQARHGLHYSTGSDCQLYGRCYVIFEGDTFASGAANNLEIEASSATTVVFSADPVFTQLDAFANPATITLGQDNKTATITVNSQGRIDW